MNHHIPFKIIETKSNYKWLVHENNVKEKFYNNIIQIFPIKNYPKQVIEKINITKCNYDNLIVVLSTDVVRNLTTQEYIQFSCILKHHKLKYNKKTKQITNINEPIPNSRKLRQS